MLCYPKDNYSYAVNLFCAAFAKRLFSTLTDFRSSFAGICSLQNIFCYVLFLLFIINYSTSRHLFYYRNGTLLHYHIQLRCISLIALCFCFHYRFNRNALVFKYLYLRHLFSEKEDSNTTTRHRTITLLYTPLFSFLIICFYF